MRKFLLKSSRKKLIISTIIILIIFCASFYFLFINSSISGQILLSPQTSVKVDLRGTSDLRQFVNTAPVIATTKTDKNGRYSFPFLGSGVYRASFWSFDNELKTDTGIELRILELKKGQHITNYNYDYRKPWER